MLEKEIKKFKEIQADLKAEYPMGGYVVILDEKVLGVWNDRMDALKEGIKIFGNIQFLVKNIMDDDKINYFSRPLQFS